MQNLFVQLTNDKTDDFTEYEPITLFLMSKLDEKIFPIKCKVPVLNIYLLLVSIKMHLGVIDKILYRIIVFAICLVYFLLSYSFP